MPKYTIEFDTDVNNREAGLQFVVARYNAALAEGEPAIDATAYLQKTFDEALDSYAMQAEEAVAAELKEKFKRADQATRDQITTFLEKPIIVEESAERKTE